MNQISHLISHKYNKKDITLTFSCQTAHYLCFFFIYYLGKTFMWIYLNVHAMIIFLLLRKVNNIFTSTTWINVSFYAWFFTHANIKKYVELICMNNVQCLYVVTNGVYHNHGISNLNNDFKNQVLLNNYPKLFICNFIVLFLNNIYAGPLS